MLSVFLCWSFIVLSFDSVGCDSDGHIENVALNKPCNMSSQWDEPVHPAGWAVNGDRGAFYDSHENCIHTLLNPGWWQVDLGRPYPLHSFTVWARDYGLVRRMADCVITVDGKFCYRFPENTTDFPLRIDFNCTSGVINGSVVKVYKDSTAEDMDFVINFCEFEAWSCGDAYWGRDCVNVCGQCRYGEPCDKVTGQCGTCIPGWKHPLCTECLDGLYGENCLEACSRNCDDVCDKVTGHCTCKPGWKQPDCATECDDGSFGQNCSRTCSMNCLDVCDKVTGHCTCKPGWKQPDCTRPCEDGTYGLLCSRSCSENCATVCEKDSGQCTCNNGWKPSTCRDACDDGYHGLDCSRACGENCDDVCDRVTGHCTCKPGWLPPDCTQSCGVGYYGQNCSKNCSTNCASDVCDVALGDCTCKTGWKPPRCDQKCEGGTYGENCGETCGTCYDGAPCHHVTGHCEKCEKSLELPFCRAEPVISQANVGIIAGAAVGVLILSILAGVLALYIRKIRQRRRAGEYQPETAVLGADVVCTRHIDYDNQGYSNNGGHKNHVLGEDLHPEIKPNETAHTTTNGDAFWHGSDSEEGKQSPDPLQLSSLSSNGDDNDELDTVMSLLEVDSDTGEGRETAENEAHDGSDVYMMPEAADLRLDSIPQSLLGKLRGSGVLDAEFGKLPFGLQKEHDCGSKEENQHSNRFDSIIPYDATRVVLHGDPPSDFSDYINASYIRGYWSWKTYIATQGPMANTVEEFWKMVLQERVTQIVMLTNVQEGDKIKSEEYWPEAGSVQTYGSVQVTTVDVQKRADYFIRMFDISGSGSYSSRQVTQYHYVTWPVHSVPNVSSLVDFWRTVTSSHHNQQSPPPLLVQCSAGVGRTGLFIGLDIAMDHAENESQVDIFHIVERMREDRCNMVQTKAQYRFLHMVALEACISRATRVPVVGFDTFFPTHIDPAQSNQKIDAEFEMLTQTKVLMQKHPHTEALKEENIDKNRNHEVLPADRHLVSLTDDIKGRNQYINAVFVKTLFANRGCILTQLPLPHTLIDIWRLVTGYDVNTIVSLGSEVLGPEKNCCYWPREQKHPMKFGPFAVTLLSKEQLGEHLTSYSIQLKSKGTSKNREVTLLHYSGWSGELPASTPDVISLVDMMTSQSMDEGKHPVVVQCIDGGSRSGLFRAICDVISRMKYDRDVDVYTAVKHLHSIRPECLTSLTSYRYLYHIVQEYKTSGANQNSRL